MALVRELLSLVLIVGLLLSVKAMPVDEIVPQNVEEFSAQPEDLSALASRLPSGWTPEVATWEEGCSGSDCREQKVRNHLVASLTQMSFMPLPPWLLSCYN